MLPASDVFFAECGSLWAMKPLGPQVGNTTVLGKKVKADLKNISVRFCMSGYGYISTQNRIQVWA